MFLDTPGHKAFNNLRKRGGNLADVSIVVVDVLKGIEDQTIESIEILRSYKTPFIIALNKIDLIPGWKNEKGLILDDIKKQSESTRNFLEQKLYEVVGKLYELNFAFSEILGIEISQTSPVLTANELSSKLIQNVLDLFLPTN